MSLNQFPPTQEEEELAIKVAEPEQNGFTRHSLSRTINYTYHNAPIPDFWTCNKCGAVVVLATWEKHVEWHALDWIYG